MVICKGKSKKFQATIGDYTVINKHNFNFGGTHFLFAVVSLHENGVVAKGIDSLNNFAEIFVSFDTLGVENNTSDTSDIVSDNNVLTEVAPPKRKPGRPRKNVA